MGLREQGSPHLLIFDRTPTRHFTGQTQAVPITPGETTRKSQLPQCAAPKHSPVGSLGWAYPVNIGMARAPPPALEEEGWAAIIKGDEALSADWKRIQDEMDAAAAAVLADCGKRADALCAEVYGDLYTSSSWAS